MRLGPPPPPPNCWPTLCGCWALTTPPPSSPGTTSPGGGGRAGDAAGAATAFAELLADRLRVLGTDHPDTRITRDYLAHWRGQADGASGGVR